MFKIRHPITFREYEVLQLVIQGKTNKEIAEKLFIDRRTVESFVYSILKKARSKNRCALTAAVVRGEIEFYPYNKHNKDNIKSAVNRMRVERLSKEGLSTKGIMSITQLSRQRVGQILSHGARQKFHTSLLT